MNKQKITITYCTSCRWVTRSSWIAQELLITFETELTEVALRPSKEAGTFQINLNDNLIHCRRLHNGFPELKALKQKIRDQINPELDLGHSDIKKD